MEKVTEKKYIPVISKQDLSSRDVLKLNKAEKDFRLIERATKVSETAVVH